MYKIKRFFPNANVEEFSGIIGREEFVSLGMMYGNGKDTKDIYMIFLSAPNIIFHDIDMAEEQGVSTIEEITTQQLESYIVEAKSNLLQDEQLLYFEKYLDTNFKGRDDFEFCGFDLMDDGLGTSAIFDCVDLNKSYVNKLNKFGLLDSIEDAIAAQKQLAIDFPDENHAIVMIYGVWRYIKDCKKV